MVRCPYNEVMSFVYRYKPTNKKNSEISVLEVGCGDGNNLWFLAKEGFNVNGVELSHARVQNARNRLDEDKLVANILEENFTSISLKNESMDLALDRCSITCASFSDAQKSIDEIHRVLRVGGRFYFNPYSEFDFNFFQGCILEDGRVGNFEGKSSLNTPTVNGIYFYSLKEILELFKVGWNIIEINHTRKEEILESRGYNVGTWEVIVEKTNGIV